MLSLLVERHYLRAYGGGFTENFYGLKRERVLRVRGGEAARARLGAADHVREALRLRGADVWRNLAVMVGLPYLKRKLDEGWEVHAAHAAVLGPEWRQRGDAGQRGAGASASVGRRLLGYYKWFLRRVYPSVNAAYHFALLAFHLAYLFDGSKYHSPFLWLIGTRVRRLGEADHRAIALAARPDGAAAPRRGARPGLAPSILNPRVLGRAVYPRLLSSLRILLPTSIFALKFLEWWHASDFARQLSRKAAEGLELPPPVVASGARATAARRQQPDAAEGAAGTRPQADGKGDAAEPLSRGAPPVAASSLLPIFTVAAPALASSGLCPICTSPVVTPTAAPTGFVFCYACIHRWVDGAHERQAAFMEGGAGEEGWGDEEGSREGRWESGKGRCAVTGLRVLGGTEGLRRVMV